MSSNSLFIHFKPVSQHKLKRFFHKYGRTSLVIFIIQLTLTNKTSALSLTAGICVTAGNADMVCRTLLLAVKLTLRRIACNDRLLFGSFFVAIASATASLWCKTAAASLRRCFCLCTFYMNILSVTTIIIIVGTAYHTTIQFCHLTYLL